MTGPRFGWFLPTGGDGHEVGAVTTEQGRGGLAVARPATARYLGQVGQAAADAGFEAVLTPTGLGCVDPWVTTAAVSQLVDDLTFLVAFRPGLVSPTLAAQQAATFARLTGGRVALNIVTGGDPVEQRAYGDRSDHASRYARTDEFLTVLRGLLAGEEVTFRGAHVDVEAARLVDPPAVPPQIYLGGASEAALDIAARHVDAFLTWVDSYDAVLARRADVVARAAAHGRTVRVGVRVHVVARPTSAEAWAEADRLLAGMDPAAIAASQARYARMDSVAQRSMTRLHGGRTDALVVDRNLWAGVGLVREGAATALVGSYDEVAARIVELHDGGIDELVLSGYPHLEEALRFGEHVRPRVAALLGTPAPRSEASPSPVG